MVERIKPPRVVAQVVCIFSPQFPNRRPSGLNLRRHLTELPIINKPRTKLKFSSSVHLQAVAMASISPSTILLIHILLPLTTAFARTVRPFSKPPGFSIDLTHRDSSLSPLYDPSSTLAQRAKQATLRSVLRSQGIASRFANTSGTINSPVMPGLGDYLMKLSLGTPSRLYWAELDTGSDLIWTTCSPCDSCPSSEPSMFDPTQSSTYVSQYCSTSSCMELEQHRCISSGSLCEFRYSYGDGSSIEGILSSETLSFDDGTGTIRLPGIAFGCVHDETSPSPSFLKITGLVGFGQGSLSFVQQIGPSIDHKFAYCLPPQSDGSDSVGQLKFGENAEFSGNGGVQETPMTAGGDLGTYYVLTLTDISVGNNRLNIQFGGARTPPLLGDARSIIIDSGTTLTYLAEDVYDQVENAVANVISNERFYSSDPDELCYQVEDNDPYEGLPEMTFHFANYADWKLPPSNTFRFFGQGAACFAIAAGTLPVFGNVAQQNMYVKYDLANELLSFAPTECSSA